MNPRVKEILSEARKCPMGNSWTYELDPDKVMEKFAKMLLTESAQLCCRDITEEECTKAAGKYYSRKIKQHFGI